MKVVDSIADEFVGQGYRGGKLRKIIETGALVASWIVMGMYAEVSGPTLIDLKSRLNTGYEDLASALSARGAGTFPGCIVGGILVDKLGGWSHLMVAITLDVAAVAVIYMPWVPTVDYIWALCFISGFAQAIHNSSGTLIALNIWKDKSASPLILIHLGYGIGSFFTPLMSSPFLGTMISNSSNETKLHNDTDWSGTANESVAGPSPPPDTANKYAVENSRIEYPYAISGIATASLSIVFFAFQVIEYKYSRQENAKSAIENKNKESNTERSVTKCEDVNKDTNAEVDDNLKLGKCEDVPKDINTEVGKAGKCEKIKRLIDMINPASCAKGRFWYGLSIVFLMFFYFGNAAGCQHIVSQFVRSYSIDQLNFASESGTLINTSYWISFSIGRFLFFIFAKWVSVNILIFVEAFGATCAAVLMAIFADDSSVALWVLIQPVAFFWGPVWPTGIGWTDYHMELTGMGMASQILGASVGTIFHMRLIGYLYENISPKTYLYHVAGSAIFGLLLAVSLDIIGARHGNRFIQDTKDCVEERNGTNSDSTNNVNNESDMVSTRL